MEGSETTIARSKRRWLKFSLRTMLIAIALFAVWLGPQVNRVREQRRAVERILGLGGSIFYGYQTDDSGGYLSRPQRYQAQPHGPEWLSGWIGPDYFNSVVAVSLGTTEVSDDDLAYLRGLPELRSLSLEKTHVSSEGLAHLKGLRHLRRLFLGSTDIEDEGLQHISHLTELEILQLNERITDAGLRQVESFRKLKHLTLNDTQITDHGLAHLAALTDLERLNLHGTQVTNAGLQHLMTMGKLRLVYAKGTPITPEGAARLQSEIPGLRVSVDRGKQGQPVIHYIVESREVTRLGVVVSCDPCTVRDILPSSPATRADVKKGDIFLNADGEAVASEAALLRVVERQDLGGRLRLELRRGEQTINTEVTLDNF